MNYFKRIFSKNGSVNTSDNIDTSVEEKIDNPDLKEIFIENNPPVESTEVNKVKWLNDFLARNFSKSGFLAGYDYHTSQCLALGINNIRSEYQHLLEILIEEKESEIYSLEINKIQTEGISESLLRQMDLRISKLQESIDKCKSEMELSGEGRGHIETPLNKFKEGFEKGMTQYFNEKYFAQSTGLFN